MHAPPPSHNPGPHPAPNPAPDSDASPRAPALNWLFVDMNSFFASVEQHLNPELRDRPVAVVPMIAEGTSVIAASHDAKRLGIRVGTSVPEARRLCPAITFVPARPPVYVEVHHAILASVDKCAPIHRVYSIDEWAIRLLRNQRHPEHAAELARTIKAQLRADLGPTLTCSIGIAPTRLLAKIASDLHKPDGLTILTPDDLPQRIEHLALNDLPGIGPGMLTRLHAAGIRSITDLWNLTPKDARRIWGGVAGESWLLALQGHDLPEPTTCRRTINQSNVLSPDHRNDHGAHAVLVRLICRGAFRLRHTTAAAHRLTIEVRSWNHPERWTIERPLDADDDTLTLIRAFESAWATRPWARDPHALRRWEPFRQVSMTLSGLDDAAATATPLLFDQPERERLRRLSAALDTAEQKWGRHTIYLGAVHHHRHRMDSKIAFGRIPDRADQEAWENEKRRATTNPRQGLR
ncbi:MAG: Y-family DNA polymerase [Phycisphaerales bacterium]